jgi:uncharacterized protein (UPF0333 family)
MGLGKKKGQATVEFLLMIAVLVPMIVATISYINSHVFNKMNSWLQHEVVSQVRYGYSRDYFQGQFNDANAAKTSGQGPVMYGPTSNSGSKHPLTHVKEGWI